VLALGSAAGHAYGLLEFAGGSNSTSPRLLRPESQWQRSQVQILSPRARERIESDALNFRRRYGRGDPRRECADGTRLAVQQALTHVTLPYLWEHAITVSLRNAKVELRRQGQFPCRSGSACRIPHSRGSVPSGARAEDHLAPLDQRRPHPRPASALRSDRHEAIRSRRLDRVLREGARGSPLILSRAPEKVGRWLRHCDNHTESKSFNGKGLSG
jgi:hypothetical protein